MAKVKPGKKPGSKPGGVRTDVAKRSPPKKVTRKPAKRATASSTAEIRWFDGPTQRLGTVTGARFTEVGLRLEIQCNYQDVSRYSLTFNFQNASNRHEYSGSWESDARRTGAVDVKLNAGVNSGYLMKGNWSEFGQTWGWETSEIAISPS